MFSTPLRSLLFAALFLALGLGTGWWLRGASDLGRNDAPPTMAQEGPASPEGHASTPERRAIPLNDNVRPKNETPSHTTDVPSHPLAESAPVEDAPQRETTDWETILRDRLENRAFGAAIDLYQNVERQDLASAGRLRQIILEYLEGYLRSGDDLALTQLVEGFLSVHYDDIAVLTLLSRHQQQSGYWAEAARTFQLAFSYTEAQPSQRSLVNQAFDQFVHAMDQQLVSEQRWQTLISFYETLEQLDLSQPPELLRLGQLYLTHGEPVAGRNLLERLAGHPSVGAQASALLNNNTAPTQAERRPPPPVGSIPLDAIGSHYALPLTLDGRQDVRLVIDTGASITTLSQQAFDRVSASARFTELGPQLFNTAGGTSSGMVYRVDSLQLGKHQLTDVAIAVLDFNTPGNIDGLLGMNVLRNFRFEVDQDQQVLKLQPRP
ncbi:retropepsin-like aspartic protease [Marinimicrobium agarilyticum]|uniref:retropepsin-like aspartic protease n=1 Tax=Marinimicrobium agarilyticum TaxID=306546 RepID=UPI0003F9BAE0|nr:retropepsin-like aspartic protease [Marinimicrobium agarilyticum]